MTPEKIDRVMKLIERYGGESYAEGVAVNIGTAMFYRSASDGTLDEIRAALTEQDGES